MGFKVDAFLPPGIREAREAALRFEAQGFDGLFAAETSTDPFVDLSPLTYETSRPVLGTSLAIAFPRSPFVTAVIAWQLQKASGGRFVLGLGTQVKGHIERRFGMTWESPGPKFREYVEAVRELWRAFAEGGRPSFRGRFYTHTLTTPFFQPGPIDQPPPSIWIAAINEYNAETVGLVADGLLVHPLHSPKYIDEVLMPRISKGLADSGRSRQDISLQCPVFLVAGDSPEERQGAEQFVRSQISFYGSTRSYRKIFETHGWDDTPARLHELMASGDFGAMAAEITDEMLETFAIIGRTDEIADKIRAKYDGIADRVYPYNLYASPFADDEGRTKELIRALQA